MARRSKASGCDAGEWPMASLLERIGMAVPIIQAPMAGTSTPQMAAAVTNAGGLGSIGLGAVNAAGARTMIGAVRAAANGAFNVNVFCHAPATAAPERERAWLEALKPEFERFGAEPPAAIGEIYKSFLADEDMLELLIVTRPAVVSFHFGLPAVGKIARLKAAGVVLFATATNLAEAQAAAAAGVDAIVAQGWEAGGHRGVFDPSRPDSQLGVLALTRLLVREIPLPIIAAGGIMDGAGVAAALDLGAEAVQMGTAFIGCPDFERRRAPPRSAVRPGRGANQNDLGDLRPSGPLPAEPLHRAEGRRAGRSSAPGLSDRL